MAALRQYLPLPHGVQGLRIGIFGGSFNPPHQGHRDVADFARKRLDLDQIWWLVSLKNPLKPAALLDDFNRRVSQVCAMASRPTDRVVTVEAALGTGVTAQVLTALKPALERQRPVWIMGSDSFASLHRWHEADRVMAAMPMAIIARPGATIDAMRGPMAQRFANYRCDQMNARALVDKTAPNWVALAMRWNPTSSTALRAITS